MGSRRLRLSIGGGVTVAVVIAAASLVSGTMNPALEVAGAIPPGVIVGFVVYLVLPKFTPRR